MTVATDAETYPADRQPSFTFAVENVSEEACSRDVGQAANELRVTSGGTQVWSSDDCNPGGDADRTSISIRATGSCRPSAGPRRSRPRAARPRRSRQPPATYQVVARNLEILSEPAVFVLE